MKAGLDAYHRSLHGCALLVESRLLGEAVWLVADDAAARAFGEDLRKQGDARLILTLAEVEALRGMAEADVVTLARVKRHLPGASVRSVEKLGTEADA